MRYVQFYFLRWVMMNRKRMVVAWQARPIGAAVRNGDDL